MKEYNGRYVTLMLCSECNNDCSHCYISFKGHFNDEQLSHIVPNLMNKYGVLMNGTEPILFDEYFKYFKMAGNDSIMTNGIALIDNIDLMEKLQENGISVIMLSYHYGIQDEISGIKTEQLDKLVKQLTTYGFTVKLMCSLSTENYMYIDECCKKAYELGAKIVRFTNFIDQGCAQDNFQDSVFLNREQINYVLNEIERQRSIYDKDELYIERCGTFGPKQDEPERKFGCLDVNNMAVVTPDRKVYGCIFDTSPGNEIGYLDDDDKIMLYDDAKGNKGYCRILKKYNNIDN